MKSIVIASIFFTILTFGCGSDKENDKSDNVFQNEIQGVATVGQISARWPDPENIPVCWIEDDDWVPERVKRQLQEHITNEIHNKTIVRLTGWNSCDPNTLNDGFLRTPEIRIDFLPEIPGAAGSSSIGPMIGPFCDSDRAVTLRLNLLSQYIDTGTLDDPDDASWDLYIEGIKGTFLHEIGHALGLLHEHTRSDRPEICGGYDDILYGAGDPDDETDIIMGDFNPNSIMDYCHEGNELSEGDAATINIIQGCNTPLTTYSCPKEPQAIPLGEVIIDLTFDIPEVSTDASGNTIVQIQFESNNSSIGQCKFKAVGADSNFQAIEIGSTYKEITTGINNLDIPVSTDQSGLFGITFNCSAREMVRATEYYPKFILGNVPIRFHEINILDDTIEVSIESYLDDPVSVDLFYNSNLNLDSDDLDSEEAETLPLVINPGLNVIEVSKPNGLEWISTAGIFFYENEILQIYWVEQLDFSLVLPTCY